MTEEEKFNQELYEEHFRVAIFGSARIEDGDPRYERIEELAQMIGAEGIDVITGGGPGIMEAANKGHKQGNKNGEAHSFGLNIALPHEQESNRHLDLEKDFDRFSERLDTFMSLSNVVVVAPGGIGTMLELFYTWQLVQVKHICSIPIILLGDMWPELIEWMEKWQLDHKLISQNDMNSIFLADNCKEAFGVIKKAHDEFQKGNKDFCLNFKKYKLQ